MPIYTRTGDKGKTSLFDGTRVSKAHPRVETYAAMDELNSVLGEVLSFMPKNKLHDLRKEILVIQHDLFTIGSALANPTNPDFGDLAEKVTMFEKKIDSITAQVPPLKNFILPGGSRTSSLLQVARTLARRAERRLVALMQDEDVDKALVMYINRLSDLLFMYARYANFVEKKQEIKWIKKG